MGDHFDCGSDHSCMNQVTWQQLILMSHFASRYLSSWWHFHIPPVQMDEAVSIEPLPKNMAVPIIHEA